VSRNLALLRGHYEDVLVLLMADGVQVSIRFLNDEGLSADDYADALAQRGCEVRLAPLQRGKRAAPEHFALRLRQFANLLRFYHPDYRDGGAWLREQKFSRAAVGPRRWARRIGSFGGGPASVALRLARVTDRMLPPGAWAEALISAEDPDVVVAVPVIRSPQFVDVLKSAAIRGLPTVSWVQSWDNLSSKGLLNFVPDKVFVWNDTQRSELARYHGVPRENVCLTGAQTFDHWFREEGPSDRDAFCADHGFDPAQPIVLYLASSRQLEPSADAFFERWLASLRGSSLDMLRRVSVLARPHPTELESWVGRARDGVSVSPSTRDAPINSEQFRRRYRDELRCATVAVGLNTSGMIDAAIFGKPVCAVELPEFDFLQRGTQHFHYLKTVAGGLLYSADSLESHLETLAGLIQRDSSEADERSQRFVKAFIRPHGLDVRSAAIFADEMLLLFGEKSRVRLPGPVGRVLARATVMFVPTLFEDEPLRELARRTGKNVKRARKRLRKRRSALKTVLQRILGPN
jgi:hypothetical protein